MLILHSLDILGLLLYMSTDVHGPANSGTRQVYQWRGRFIEYVEDSGLFDTESTDAISAITGGHPHLWVFDADHDIYSPRLTFEQLSELIRVWPDLADRGLSPGLVTVNDRPWAPRWA